MKRFLFALSILFCTTVFANNSFADCPAITPNTSYQGIPVKVLDQTDNRFWAIVAQPFEYNNTCMAPYILQDSFYGAFVVGFVANYQTNNINEMHFTPALEACSESEAYQMLSDPTYYLSLLNQSDENIDLSRDYGVGIAFRVYFQRCPVTCGAGEVLWENYEDWASCQTCEENSPCCLDGVTTYTLSDYRDLEGGNYLCPVSGGDDPTGDDPTGGGNNEQTGSSTTTCDTVTVRAQTPVVPLDYTDNGNDYGYISKDGTRTYNEDTYGLTDNNTWATAFDDGVVYGRASCQPSLTTDNQGTYYIASHIGDVLSGDMSVADFQSGLLAIIGDVKTTTAMGIFNDMVSGTISEDTAYAKVAALLSVVPNAQYSTNDSGRYCYCQIDGYKPDGQSKQTISNANWSWANVENSAENCADNCAISCSSMILQDNSFGAGTRSALYGSYTASATCESDTPSAPARLRMTALTPTEADGTIIASGAYAKGAYNANVGNINNALTYVEASSVETIKHATVSAENVSLSVAGFTPAGTIDVDSSNATVSGTVNVANTVAMLSEWGTNSTENGTLSGSQQVSITNGAVTGMTGSFSGPASGQLSGTGSLSNASVHVNNWVPVNPQQ